MASAHDDSEDEESPEGENASGSGAEKGTETEGENPTDPEEEDADRAGSANDGTASVTFTDHHTTGSTVTVDSVNLPDGGFVSIHDRRRFEDKLLPSIIGITDFLEPGQYDNVTVPLFTANATAPGPAEGQDQNGLTESQPLIAIPHRDANDSGAFNGEPNPDPAYKGPGTLEELTGAVNDIATLFVNGADQEERNQAKTEEQQARNQFSGN